MATLELSRIVKSFDKYGNALTTSPKLAFTVTVTAPDGSKQMLTLTDDCISAITWFGERSLLAHFGLPRTLPQ